MNRYILQNNEIKDTKNNIIIGTYTDKQFHNISEMIRMANYGEIVSNDEAAWLEEEKRIFNNGGHIAGLSDW